ncbi:MAG TPA: DUF3243 domain-containing protein [Syntrophomonadaceae bacterium]|jgi:hypothetical protein|nr:DUF3243 domain-containing protein [Syntrophomonadaceae bacterium]HRX21024.1 DUF3243 domain-containing protein [Syntrophomonadaceae bacterium]
MELNQSETFSHWEQWKKTLAKTVSVAETVGMSEKSIDKIALKIGDILTDKVDPENREQRLLQELWRSGDENDRAVLARLIVDMVKTDVRH